MNIIKAGLAGVALSTAAAGAASATSVCLITKDDINLFFVKMAEGAFAKAAELLWLPPVMQEASDPVDV